MGNDLIKEIKKKYLSRLEEELGAMPITGEGITLAKNILAGKESRADYGFLDKIEALASEEIARHEKLFADRLENSPLEALLFPQNTIDIGKSSEEATRAKKRVTLDKKATKPITDPFQEILFTSNILLTLPRNKEWKSPLAEKVHWDEEQSYWFDHPVSLDAPSEENEILYGLRHFNQSVKEEAPNVTATVLLSITCTHKSLSSIAGEAVKAMLREEEYSNLEVYAFSEEDTSRIVDKYITLSAVDKAKVKEVFGVDGLYGRHYSFLKGVLSFWNRFVDPRKRATFKIDLDQVFDQEKLKRDTGSFAFEKFTDPRWGSTGHDSSGREVFMGLLAGSLVNIDDIEESVYTCDTPPPKEKFEFENTVMYTDRIRYFSTLVEMGTRYTTQEECLSRYHVTGGTSGILLEALERYRPFTPTFIGRAEDQGYILSALDAPVDNAYLRCFHCDGLVMRHDKGIVLTKAVKAGKIPSYIGNLERLIIWSHLAHDVLGIADVAADEMAPFTGAFIQPAPYALVFFHLLFTLARIGKDSPEDVSFLLENAGSRLTALIELIEKDFFREGYLREKEDWKIYYDFMEQTDPSNRASEDMNHYRVN